MQMILPRTYHGFTKPLFPQLLQDVESTDKFERDMAIKRRNKEEAKVLTVKHQKERDELEKNMTIRRDQKKESLTRKLLEHERYLRDFKIWVICYILVFEIVLIDLVHVITLCDIPSNMC
ncbi:hypothetical protein Anas_01128 [Armadillidium nasatum]|uniref:Uncharacterized protein n=1 Tax=Armadillidium nasatum TaxID=96803 RepID=A0A5N5THH3_9CRUS|nr:hypothetical protein Anas_01128 [Armadillidium nasatum]